MLVLARTTDMLFSDTSRTSLPCLPITSGYLWRFMCSLSNLIFHRSGHWVHSRLKHFWSFSITAHIGSGVKCFLWVEMGSLILMKKRMLWWLNVALDALLLSLYRQCECVWVNCMDSIVSVLGGCRVVTFLQCNIVPSCGYKQIQNYAQTFRMATIYCSA